MAQENTVSAGGFSDGPNGIVYYSVGQVVYQAHDNASGSLNEGVQQPYEILVITSTENPLSDLGIEAFPNPTTNRITISGTQDNLTFQLCKLNGELIESGELTTAVPTIEMGHLPSASYVLSVFQNNKITKTFKIIKNQ